MEFKLVKIDRINRMVDDLIDASFAVLCCLNETPFIDHKYGDIIDLVNKNQETIQFWLTSKQKNNTQNTD